MPSKILKTKRYKTITLPVVPYGYYISLTSGDIHRLKYQIAGSEGEYSNPREITINVEGSFTLRRFKVYSVT